MVSWKAKTVYEGGIYNGPNGATAASSDSLRLENQRSCAP